jgi:hypothetical protein
MAGHPTYQKIGSVSFVISLGLGYLGGFPRRVIYSLDRESALWLNHQRNN